ncbi:uncharacterized protein C1orf232 homolog [Protopterus annectens]|uniref:uncharacterized protein C1orf232 homolog n=1 Tax=Protopterus annectens TaxID=7888 RepID=UPI001CF9C789|nr:uncharacterized protein C1orf232 homolog [Protopterus annectens]
MMNQALWKTYKSKVLKTFGSDQEDEEDYKEQANDNEDTVESSDMTEEKSSSVSVFAQKMQGAGAKGWRTVSSLFSKDDDQKLLTSESNIPQADHPLAAKPEEDKFQQKRGGFWDIFAAKWQQTSATNQNAAQSQYGENVAECSGEMTDGQNENLDYSENSSDLRDMEDTGFKWGFLTSKLAELKSRNLPKSN